MGRANGRGQDGGEDRSRMGSKIGWGGSDGVAGRGGGGKG